MSSVAPATSFSAEARANLRLALPLIAAQLAGVGMGAIDAVMAGHLGARELAAVAVAVNLNVVLFVFFMGIFMACSAIVSQRRGASDDEAAVGRFARSLLKLALVIAALWCGLTQLLAAPVLNSLHLDATTTKLAIAYLRAFVFSSFGLSLWFALRFVAEGLEVSRPVMIAGLLGLAINMLFNWLLIYGIGPFPQLGLVGSGWATTLACLVMAATLAIYYRFHPRLKAVQLFGSHETEPGAVREVLRLGVPIGLILIAEAGLFVAVALMMARIGERTVAAYQVAINFASVAFMIPLGIGLATTVRVGFFAGANQPLLARHAGIVGMKLGVANAALNAAVMVLFASIIVALYTQDAGIAKQAVGFLSLAAAFQFFDGLQATANGALRGHKDTRVPMVITLVSYWLIGLPVAWWLGFYTPLGPDGLWWGLSAGLAAAAAGLSWRFLHRAAQFVRSRDSF